jgi:anthranilate synthase component 1
MESLAASAFSPSRLAAHPSRTAAAAAAVPVSGRAVAAGGRRRRSGRGSGGVRWCAASPSASAVINGSAAAKAAEEDRRRFFEAAARGSGQGNLVPLWECIVSDHLTPVLAYRCLVGEDDMDTPSFLFESVEQGPEGTTNVVCPPSSPSLSP